MQSNYKLVGFINSFNVIPDFVYPIFECDQDKKLYFEFAEDKNKLENLCFLPLEKESYKSMVIFLDNINHNLNDTQIIITTSSKAISGFQTSENEIKFGNYEYFKKFFESYETEDEYLQEEILDFLENCNL